MGGFGYFFTPQAVFFVTAALLVPTLLVLRGVAAAEIDPERAHGNLPELRARDRSQPRGRDCSQSSVRTSSAAVTKNTAWGVKK